MKMIFLVLTLVLCFCEKTTNAEELQFLPSDPEVLAEEAWSAFKVKYAKNYSGAKDEERRQQIFYDNLKIIQSHNHLYEQGLASYNMGINQFSDLEFSEFVEKHGLRQRNDSRPVESDGESDESSERFDGEEEEETESSISEDGIPCRIDWRHYGYVTGVKYQGQCGSGWAFATTGTIEGQIKRKTGRLVSLSEQNLIDCSQSAGNNGCHGGWPDWALKYIKDNGGIDTEYWYKYRAKAYKCYYSRVYSAATVRGHVNVQCGNEYALKKAIATVGPIAVSINVEKSFQHYKSGIFYDSQCSNWKLNHDVLVVGYGSVGSHYAHRYYIVKNSFGTSWGSGGYIYMARYRGNMCGIASHAVYPLV